MKTIYPFRWYTQYFFFLSPQLFLSSSSIVSSFLLSFLSLSSFCFCSPLGFSSSVKQWDNLHVCFADFLACMPLVCIGAAIEKKWEEKKAVVLRSSQREEERLEKKEHMGNNCRVIQRQNSRWETGDKRFIQNQNCRVYWSGFCFPWSDLWWSFLNNCSRFS